MLKSLIWNDVVGTFLVVQWLQLCTSNAEDQSLLPGWGRSPGEGNGNSLQYSCLGNPTDRGGRWATVHRVAKSQKQLSEHTHRYYVIIKIYHNLFIQILMDIWDNLELDDMNNASINTFSWILVPGYILRSGIVGWEDGLLTNLIQFLLGGDFGLLPSNTISMETYRV